MGDGSITPRLGNMKALLGIVAGAGASYGLYKLLSGGGFKKNKKSATNESPGVRGRPPGEVSLQPGSLLAKVSGLDVVCARPANTDSADVSSGEENRDRAHGRSKPEPQVDRVSAEKDSDQNRRTEAQTEIKDTNGLDIEKFHRENGEDDRGDVDYVTAEEIPTRDKKSRDAAHEKSKAQPLVHTVSVHNKRTKAQIEIKDTNEAQSDRENDEDSLSTKEGKRDILRQNGQCWESEEESTEYMTEERVKTKVKVCKRSGRHEQKEYRNCKAGPKVYKIAITRKQWNNIKPKHGKNNLATPWTNMLYNEFRKTNPSCTLAFTYQHAKGQRSRDKCSSFFCATAKCTFDGCKAAYMFSMKTKPSNVGNQVSFSVKRVDDGVHMKNQKRFRPARYIRRGKIAKRIRKGYSNYYHKQLKKPSSNGYLQYLQINPFAVHLHTDIGIRILAEHLRKTSPVTLHLDATGSVVWKIPCQTKKVLYYTLVLPAKGKDQSPLPVTELITNSHSISSISHWLVEFKRKLSYKSKRQIAQLETDYSWTLINSGLTAFNKENISNYLNRAFEIAAGHMYFIPKFTVLHLCSAHIIKAVSYAFSKKSEDRSVKEYATFCFVYLLNCRHMHMALEVFYHMCVLFDAQDQTSSVFRSKTYLDDCVFKIKHIRVEDGGPGMKEEESSGEKKANAIMAKSPFTSVFQAQRDQAKTDVLSDDPVNIQNSYYCPGVIGVLLENYMGIFPLWSGLLLGDLSRHEKGSDITVEGTFKTPDTNCHIGLWFALAKDTIPLNKKNLRPSDFISKMFASLQGRYVEHIIRHNLPLHILDRDEQVCGKPGDEHKQHLNKCGGSDTAPERTSKYFKSPKKLLKPKRRPTIKSQKSVAEDHEDIHDQVKSLWKRTNTEVVVAVIPLQTKGRSLLIHHSELCTLRPHQWLTGEVIGGLFHVAAHTMNVEDSIYLLDHYTAGVILFGDRKDLPRHILPKVNFEHYGAVLSFVLVNCNHWKLLYINAETSKVYLIDPAPGSPELDDSNHAAKKIHEYFKMRRTYHAKTDWVDIKWRGGVVHHPFQQDGNNCGVIVVKIAEALMQAFPLIPVIKFHTSMRAMQKDREILALKLLKASVLEEHSTCAMCAASKPPGSAPPITDWIQCDMCARWFHVQCIAMDSMTYEKNKDRKWECPLNENLLETDIIRQSPGTLEPQHLKMLLSCLQTSNNQSDTCRIILTLGNASAFTVNQNLIREFEGIPVIAGFLSDPAADVRVQTLNALNNLCMNIPNQEQIKVYVPQVLELIETSPVNSEVQLGALRLLTNLSVTDKHQHLLKESITLLLSLLVVSNEVLQVQALKVLVNLSSNPDMMDDIVQAQAPASVLLLFDARTAPAVLLRLLTFTGNLKAWRPSAQVAEELRRKQDCLFRVMLDESSQLHSRLVQLLSHPDGEIQAQVARVLT